MKPERIEEIIQANYAADEPEGTRERILRRAYQELPPAGSRVRIVAKWAPAAVAAIVLFAGISDHARQARLCRMAGTDRHQPRLTANIAQAIAEREKLTREMLAYAGFSLEEDKGGHRHDRSVL